MAAVRTTPAVLQKVVADVVEAVDRYRKSISSAVATRNGQNGVSLEVILARKNLANALRAMSNCDGAVTPHGLVSVRFLPLVASILPPGVTLKQFILYLDRD